MDNIFRGFAEHVMHKLENKQHKDRLAQYRSEVDPNKVASAERTRNDTRPMPGPYARPPVEFKASAMQQLVKIARK